ncbi:hypothetical protein Tco_0335122 [Tanacetum coccineum]
MLTTNPQATIASKEQLVPRANRLVIKKNNQHVTSDSDITDTMLRFVVGILRHHKLYKLVSLTTIRAIMSVLNRSLTGKDSSWDTARLPTLQILWGIIHTGNLDVTSLIWDEFEWQTVDRSTKPSKISQHDTKIYKAKKAESKKAKAAEEPKEQNVSPIRSGRGKWYMRSGD